MTLGEKICQLRTQAGLSQEDLAEKTGVSRQSVSKWETDASTPELEKLIQLSKIFEITLDSLVRNEPQETAKPETPPVEIPQHGSGFFTPARIVGTILFAAALLGILLSLIFPGAPTGLVLILCGYLLICGLLCITVRKHPGLAVAVLTLVCVLLMTLLISIFTVRRIEGNAESYIESVAVGTMAQEP